MSDKTVDWGYGFTKPPQSYWIASVPENKYPSLEEDIKVDVAIVGGGIVGITSAYLLKNQGLKVAVLESSRILHGTTGHTTAKLTSQHDLIYDKVLKKMGEEKARQYADANQSAIEMVASLVSEKKIDCDFHRCPAYVYTQDEKYIQKIEDEVNTAIKLGINAAYLDQIPLPFSIKAAFRFDNQARFHVLKYLAALAKEIPGDGSHIFEQSKARDIQPGNPCIVDAAHGHKVTADAVIIATHYPFYDGNGFYFARIYPDRSYLMGIKIKEKFPDGMFLSAETPGRTLRSQPFKDGELVLVGGEHHKTGQGEDTSIHYNNIKMFAEQTFDVEDIPYRWSTQDYTPADEVPYIGCLTSKTPNIYVATGFRKWGMTTGTVAAVLIKDLILKGESPWQELYNPSRFTPAASVKNFIVENADVAKHLISGKLASIPDNVEIKKGEGKVVDVDGERVGAFRDEKGKLHLVNTTCTHLGCELQWNSAERSWDCPCHGSRFSYEGEVIEGPAQRPLSREINGNNQGKE